MPDREEIEEITESFLDETDRAKRRQRTLPWRECMEPTPETDEAEWRDDSHANRCVCCGAIIPEGRQICPNCNGERSRK